MIIYRKKKWSEIGKVYASRSPKIYIQNFFWGKKSIGKSSSSWQNDLYFFVQFEAITGKIFKYKTHIHNLQTSSIQNIHLLGFSLLVKKST